MYQVTRYGACLYQGSHQECWVWLHGHQPHSVWWATQYEGYKIELLKSTR